MRDCRQSGLNAALQPNALRREISEPLVPNNTFLILFIYIYD
nr:MAG TPA: hypothetical protein [Caudoviricetes sp.]DAR56258.1 MAG TPA: hypothetical protein [Caudoviricetes sp.]